MLTHTLMLYYVGPDTPTTPPPPPSLPPRGGLRRRRRGSWDYPRTPGDLACRYRARAAGRGGGSEVIGGGGRRRGRGRRRRGGHARPATRHMPPGAMPFRGSLPHAHQKSAGCSPGLYAEPLRALFAAKPPRRIYEREKRSGPKSGIDRNRLMAAASFGLRCMRWYRFDSNRLGGSPSIFG